MSFYRNVVGVLLVFDVTNRKSFEHIRDWHQGGHFGHSGPDKAIFMLVGPTKSDLQVPLCLSLGGARRSWLPPWAWALWRPPPKVTAMWT